MPPDRLLRCIQMFAWQCTMQQSLAKRLLRKQALANRRLHSLYGRRSYLAVNAAHTRRCCEGSHAAGAQLAACCKHISATAEFGSYQSPLQQEHTHSRWVVWPGEQACGPMKSQPARVAGLHSRLFQLSVCLSFQVCAGCTCCKRQGPDASLQASAVNTCCRRQGHHRRVYLAPCIALQPQPLTVRTCCRRHSRPIRGSSLQGFHLEGLP